MRVARSRRIDREELKPRIHMLMKTRRCNLILLLIAESAVSGLASLREIFPREAAWMEGAEDRLIGEGRTIRLLNPERTID